MKVVTKIPQNQTALLSILMHKNASFLIACVQKDSYPDYLTT